MGLTLNSNSLALESAGGGGSGLTEAQVDARVVTNTPWQFLTKITANLTAELEYTEIPEKYTTIRIVYDDLTFQANSYASIQLYFDGNLYTGSQYQIAGRASVNSTTANAYNTRTEFRLIDNYESGGSRHIMGFTDIGGLQPDAHKQFFSRVSSVHSSSPTNYDLGGYVNANQTQRVTGFKLYPNSNNWMSGSIKVFGMN
jgi:hypothetical protein